VCEMQRRTPLKEKRDKAERRCICILFLWSLCISVIALCIGLGYHTYEHYQESVIHNESLKKHAIRVWDMCRESQPDPDQNVYTDCEKAARDSKMNVYSRSKEEAIQAMLEHFNPISLICKSDIACGVHIWDTIRRVLEWAGPVSVIMGIAFIVCIITLCGPVFSMIKFYLIDKEATLSQKQIDQIIRSTHHLQPDSFSGNVHKIA
jgi:hypothetical protein